MIERDEDRLGIRIFQDLRLGLATRTLDAFGMFTYSTLSPEAHNSAARPADSSSTIRRLYKLEECKERSPLVYVVGF